jgi:hypothetical protein
MLPMTLSILPTTGRNDTASCHSPHTNQQHLLEMVLSFSIQQSSNLVLCTDLLPDFDIAVSACMEGCHTGTANAADMERRWREVVNLVESKRETALIDKLWCRAAVSFGLIRWWPVSTRLLASAALGPFSVVIECACANAPVVRLHSSMVLH